ncbi:MAG: hypothetical protein A2X59_06680 [Nitrospirae bacterium GWC2_42_7]|nr:MAG: hypothetical protein A2X59_06680 [Nitrospirae bacterium GWC2_42_7]
MNDIFIDDILTVEETAKFLKLPVQRVKSLARRGEIPAKKTGKDWRFKASVISNWFSDWQPNTFDPNKRAGKILERINGKKKTRL